MSGLRGTYVIKRDGQPELVSFDKITKRLRCLCDMKPELSDAVDPILVTQKVVQGVYNGVHTSQLDHLAAETAVYMSTLEPDYSKLAGRIVVSNLHKDTDGSVLAVFRALHSYVEPRTGLAAPLISDAALTIVEKHHAAIQDMVNYENDYQYNYFGFKTLERSYLLKVNGKIVERPQNMLLRVAIGLHGDSLERVRDTYELLSNLDFTHATPTLFNSATPKPQLSSCFLLTMKEDSIEGIYDTLKQCALVSKSAGGIGLAAHRIRASNSYIRGTNGSSNGLIPMLRVYNDTARYVDQGGGKRKGAFAIYLEPWHADIFDFLDLKKNHGKEENRARDLFYGLWIPDLFMKRVEAGADWTLFCPNEAPGLFDSWGKEFEEIYERHEREGRGRKTIKAQELWFAILESQIETGTPYMLYKDAINGKSNHQHLGTIQSSNLCVAPETRVLTSTGHVAIRDLAGKSAEVWNGNEWSKVDVVQTGTQQPLVTVSLSNGAQVTCTPYHKFIVHDRAPTRKRAIAEAKRVDAKDLAPGTKIVRWDAPILQGDERLDFKYPYTHGFFCGDGTINNGRPHLALYGKKKTLIEHLDIRSTSGREDASGRLNMSLPHDLAPKMAVPHGSSLSCRLRWLAGLLDADACVTRNETKSESIQLASIDRTFLDDVRLLLQTMGVQANVTQMRDHERHAMPDGKGGKAIFDCKPLWRLFVAPAGLFKLVSIGMQTHRLKFDAKKPSRENPRYVTVLSVEDNGRVDDTFCFSEPINHAGVFNGVCTGQCTEIVQYTSPDELAVCNLASLALPKFVAWGTDGKPFFDHERLRRVVHTVVYNLNRVIDVNYYPVPEAEYSNRRHRPIGMGIQGLADLFIIMRLAWEMPEARVLNREIFETIYFAGLEESCRLAQAEGTYETYQGSPVSKGILQPDMWNVTPSDRWDWAKLRADIAQHGVRNSLLVAPMPTASTSQILGNNECFEPYTTNMYERSVLAGNFVVTNEHLVRDLQALGLWSPTMKNKLMLHNGSVQRIDEIPDDIKKIYKTVWEIPQRVVLDMAADRGAFIDQSQSLNIHMREPSFPKLTSMHFYAWRKGLKTGMYYLRTRPAADAIQFTVDQEATTPKLEEQVVAAKVMVKSQPPPQEEEEIVEVCYPGCDSCGS